MWSYLELAELRLEGYGSRKEMEEEVWVSSLAVGQDKIFKNLFSLFIRRNSTLNQSRLKSSISRKLQVGSGESVKISSKLFLTLLILPSCKKSGLQTTEAPHCFKRYSNTIPFSSIHQNSLVYHSVPQSASKSIVFISFL